MEHCRKCCRGMGRPFNFISYGVTVSFLRPHLQQQRVRLGCLGQKTKSEVFASRICSEPICCLSTSVQNAVRCESCVKAVCLGFQINYAYRLGSYHQPHHARIWRFVSWISALTGISCKIPSDFIRWEFCCLFWVIKESSCFTSTHTC